MTNEEVMCNVKTAFEWWEDNARMEDDEDWSRQHEALDMAIKALEQTNKIEESNFSTEQYEADLRGAYDCGYNCGYSDAMCDIAEREE